MRLTTFRSGRPSSASCDAVFIRREPTPPPAGTEPAQDPFAALRRLVFGPGGFAFDPVTGFVYTFSESGAVIANWLREGSKVGEIIERFRFEFGIAAERAAIDVAQFCAELRGMGLFLEARSKA